MLKDSKQDKMSFVVLVVSVLKVVKLTLLSPTEASGSVIHEPNLDPDVFIVIGSDIPVSFPQAVKIQNYMKKWQDKMWKR